MQLPQVEYEREGDGDETGDDNEDDEEEEDYDDDEEGYGQDDDGNAHYFDDYEDFNDGTFDADGAYDGSYDHEAGDFAEAPG